jgi:hypothetical protein
MTTPKAKGKAQGAEDPFYDLDYDKDLITISISQQYHLLPSEQEVLHFADWYKLVAGLTGDSPLGHTVRIRKERDSKVIKSYGEYEKKIRTDWSNFRAKRPQKKWSEQDKQKTAEYFEKLFASMFGGG